MPEAAREREDKYEVPAGFVLPELSGALPPGGSVDRETLHLTSTYYDTASADLQYARLTLRRRDGDADAGWQLKVPAGKARTEIREPLADAVPQRLLDLTLGVRGGRELRRVAELRTERAVCRLRQGDGRLLAELADDRVRAAGAGGDAVVSEWREVEVELAPDLDGAAGEDLLASIGALLRRAGATPASYGSKLQRTLTGPQSAATDDQAATVGSTVRAFLREQLGVLLAGDVGLRRGEDVVHPTRVATRRMRATLRTFRRIFVGTDAAELEAELRWLALALGAVRDAEVLHRKLVGELDSLPPEVVLGPVRARLDEALLGARAKGAAELAEVMSGERYLRLLDSLRVFVEDPPFAPLAARPAAKIEKEVGRAGRKFEKRLDAALADGSDESLHRARKAGKRARYAVEAGAPALSAGAATVIDAFKELQDLLGDQHDAVVAADLLLDLGRRAGAHGANGFTFGLLYQRQLDASARLRGQVPASAKSVTGKSLPG